MEFSTKGLARIHDDQGRLALLINNIEVAHGHQHIFSPPGGGLEYAPRGRARLEEMGATDFVGDKLTPPIPELRFRAPDDQIENVVAWFRQRADRETTIGRKLTERLTKKRLLSRNDLEGLTERLSKYRRHRGARNASGEQTIYLIEVFNVVLSHRANGLLKQAAKVDTVRRKVYFATPAEINAGITRDGVSIAPISKFMVQG